jgi:sialic acid synthase
MYKKIVLDGLEITQDSLPYIIAEIGHNHQGSVEKCKELFVKAKNSGANAVKLQKRDNKKLYTKKFYNSDYNNFNSYGKTYGEHREKLEFDENQYKELFDFAKNINLTLFATPFDFYSLDFLEKFDCPFYKVASADITFIQLIKKIAETGKPIIISTGYADFDDIERVLDVINFKNDIAFLQCSSAYPAAPNQINLNVIPEMIKRYPKNIIGYSGHDSGILIPAAAYLLGARIIEKHFTLNRSFKGTDHAMSLEPEGLTKMINGFKKLKASLGSNKKEKMPYEKKFVFKMKKAIVASKNLSKGHLLTKEDIEFKSPGEGLESYKAEFLIGKKLNQNIFEDQAITLLDVE